MGRGNNLIKLSRGIVRKKKRRIGEKSAIFYRDNARAMCCKIDTPEIGKGEMGSFVAPAPTISILFSKIIISLK